MKAELLFNCKQYRKYTRSFKEWLMDLIFEEEK